MRARPEDTEYDEYYGSYIGLVPDGSVVDTLAREIHETVALLRAVPGGQEGFRYREGAWSIREVVAHLVDAERVFSYRAAAFARGDEAPLPSMDQDAWARQAGADERALQELVDEWLAVRQASVHLFRGLPETTWKRSGVASGNLVSVRALAWIIAGHELHHRALLRQRYGLEVPEAADARAAVRRPDRGKDDAWIRAFLHAAPYGFLATVDDSGQPFLNSNLYAYDEEAHCIWLHTARTGRTRSNVDAHSRVCFSVAGMGRMLPADEALEFSVEYAGVVVFGRGRVVEDPSEARAGLQKLLDRYAPHLKPDRDYRGITLDEMKRTATYRLEIEAWSGKQKEAEADFPGAFDVPDPKIPFADPAGEA